MKPEVILRISRMPDGEVIGQMVSEDGAIAGTLYFGQSTVSSYKNLSETISNECPDLNIFRCEALKKTRVKRKPLL